MSVSAKRPISTLHRSTADLWVPASSGLAGTSSSSQRLSPSLVSRPIFSADPLAFKRDRTSSTISFVVHAVIITLALTLVLGVHKHVVAFPIATVTPVEFTPYIPPVSLPVAKSSGGGGGGGAHQLVHASKGSPPLLSKVLITPPQVRIDQPKLAVEPTMLVQIPQTSKLPNLGMSQSPQITMASQGSGGGSGFGEGGGGGIGAGHGSGAGLGSGGGYGGGIMSVGGGVTAPQVIHSVDPEFTEDARRVDFQGNVSIQLVVDSHGNPQDVRIIHTLGMGLDQKAIDAVRQYKFRPAMYQGHPVSVQMVIEVDFRLH